MARILYGVNGEGLGHASRAKEVVSHLRARGNTVSVVSHDRGYAYLREYFPVEEIFGLKFAYEKGRVRYSKTFLRGVAALPHVAREMQNIRHLIENRGIDLIVTDFEPTVCFAAYLEHLPVISIDNQHYLTRVQGDYPKEHRRAATAARLVTELYALHADAYLVLSLFPAPSRRKNTYVFPPIVQQDVLDTAPTRGSYILVYVTTPHAKLASVLKGIRRDCVCYGFGKQGRDGRLVFKKPSRESFLRDLAGCDAVIANAGFSLLSEALYLGKPYVALPLKKHFEQALNAWQLERAGFGTECAVPTRQCIEEFLGNLDRYRENLAAYPREGNTRLFRKLDELIAGYATI